VHVECELHRAVPAHLHPAARATTLKHMQQSELFESQLPAGLIPGLIYVPDFLTPEEERELLAIIEGLPLREAQYRQYTARRRTLSFGAGYDFQAQQATPAPALPAFLAPLRTRAAAWIGVQPTAFVQALISEYRPGTPLGWHRDVPDYEIIVGISLAAATRIKFRRYPWNPQEKADIVTLLAAPRSAYSLRDAARWQWQHSVPPVKQLRYSITLRTARGQ
jgi:alkylated DNA repair dioxygenase AlkB